MRSNRLPAVSAAIAAALLVTSQLMASLDRGAIRGTVTDPQGAVVPGAKIVVRNADTGVAIDLVTNSAGFYLAAELVPGKYSVRIEAQGFSPLDIKDVAVGAGATVTTDAELKVGATAQSVEVSAQAQLVETTSSNFSSGVSRRYLDNLPLQGRDIQTLVQLFPGVVQSSGPSGAVFGSNSQFGGFPDPLHLVGSSVSSNGGQAGANAWFLEGALNATVGAEAATVNPSPDAVQEFNLVQNSLAAEYGRTSGMVVNVVLKSGTNELHGSGSVLNRNSVFSSTNPFARRDANGEPFLQPWSNWNDFSGTLGGPIYIPGVYDGRNRTFFFVSEDVSFLHQRQNRILTVPVANERNGDFRGDPRFADTCDPANGITNCIYDPATTVWNDAKGWFDRDPFITPVVPTDRIDPLAKFYLDSIPNPNFSDPLSPCGIYCNNYLGAVGSSMTTHNASVKVDHNISDRNRLFASWLFNPSYYTNYRYPWNGPSAQTGTGAAGANPYDTRNQLAILGLTTTFTPTLVNELRFSFGRQNLVARPNLEEVTQNSQVQDRVKDLNFWLFSPGQEVPTIAFFNVNDYFQFGPVAYQNSSTGQQAYTLSESLTKILGRHTLKGGFSFRRNNLWGSSPAGYRIGFDGYLSNNPDTWAGGSGLAEFLLGVVGQGGGSSAVQYSPWQTNDDYAAYIQDDFRVNKSLTLSIGVRYDVYGWIRERHDMLANFDLGTKNPEVNYPGRIYYMGSANHPDRNVFPANKNSVGPRIGFAWSPGGSSKTVIRGGYGLIYSNSMSAAFGQGNGAFSTLGSYVPVSTPVTDYFYMTPSWTLSQGAPSLDFPDLTANRTNDFQFVGTQSNVYGFIKSEHDPYIQQWSLFIQRELPGDIIVSAGYVGSHGSHLLGDEIRNINEVSKADMQRVRYDIDLYTYTVDPSMDGIYDCGRWYDPNLVQCSGWYALAPYPQWWSVQALLSPDGFNKYHSGQVRVEKRYSRGLNFIAAYTFSKNIVSAGLGALAGNTFGPVTQSNRGVGRISWIPGAAGGGVADGSRHTRAEDLNNLRRYDALSPDDTPHIFNFAATWELPFGKGRHFANAGGWSNAFIGGWKLTQNWNFQSGVPMFFDTVRACDGAYGYLSCRPDLIGDLSAGRDGKTLQERQQGWYNANALCPPWGCSQDLSTALWNGVYADGSAVDYNTVDPYWELGNSGLRPPSGRTPGFWNADLSLAKDFRLGETKYFNFRWDVFNAFNHQNLGVPDNHWCLPPGPNGETDYARVFGCSFGQITNVQTDPRGMQFSLRFVW
ncbi:MAG: carboxypeptidase regulatory-like domain-containing protein [Terriglobia bacterium]